MPFWPNTQERTTEEPTPPQRAKLPKICEPLIEGPLPASFPTTSEPVTRGLLPAAVSPDTTEVEMLVAAWAASWPMTMLFDHVVTPAAGPLPMMMARAALVRAAAPIDHLNRQISLVKTEPPPKTWLTPVVVMPTNVGLLVVFRPVISACANTTSPILPATLVTGLPTVDRSTEIKLLIVDLLRLVGTVYEPDATEIICCELSLSV